MSLEELKAAIVAEVVRSDDIELLREFADRLMGKAEPAPPEPSPPPEPAAAAVVVREPAIPATAVAPTAPEPVHASTQSEDRIIGYTIDGDPEYMTETLVRWEMDYERAVKTGSLRSMEETYIAAMQTLGIDV